MGQNVPEFCDSCRGYSLMLEVPTITEDAGIRAHCFNVSFVKQVKFKLLRNYSNNKADSTLI